ncbi:2-hydroxychromene-2-carboxylate isomerase [Caballeronia glathei]|jgi:2-hydroxychromene-2-carboxylate isomerase|uniref:2-hydroxychromene-2-carboxylate isomerase n=1 Tax=Caballeronia glathei TaxID=60547 RepID=A0A069PHV4_9BURK|nr:MULTISPECIES: 2-hydroxychromene-2-carboxylate isomerase [Burkholderiaceae]KDR39947.1 2-hydroxychromene-2-carboxylate isomerase [Caballeronia glathei]TCK42705.1 2-hydroxychromene-2-carboxylate isomerase [Paraburkholderia sp. BL8N3]CEJ96069.1 2-hydroxychromene-2-carboxylate isomerase [Caballeronia glathei]
MSAPHSTGHGQPYFFFDFISPFSYLLLEQHDKWPDMPFKITPVSLMKLLERWGQPHAATIPSKRVFTYRHALFRAEQLGIPFRMPPTHPFDPSKALRLAVAAGGELACIREIFRYIWREGRDPATPEGFRELCLHVGLPDGETLIEQEDAKAKLRENNDLAVTLGVFGVPTFVVNDQLFWGEDTLPMVLYVARSPNWLEGTEVRRISNLPMARTDGDFGR